jgi:hypothetical protein
LGCAAATLEQNVNTTTALVKMPAIEDFNISSAPTRPAGSVP